MKKVQTILFFILLLFSCSNPVNESKRKINENIKYFILPSATLINSTIDFAIYSNPENYWFRGNDRDETQSVVDKLQNLINLVESFEYGDYDMMEAKGNLIEEAKASQTRLISSYNNRATSDYWAYQFLGELGLLGNRRPDSMPKKLKKSISEMDSITRARYFVTLSEKVFQLELFAIGNQTISLEQFKEVRTHTLQSVRDTLTTTIQYEDDKLKTGLINNIITAFSNQYPVNESYKYIFDNHEYSGTLLKFMAASNDSHCLYDDILPGDCNWGYIFITNNKKVIRRFECFDADTIEYEIGSFQAGKNEKQCLFKKSYAYLASSMNNEDSTLDEEFINKGIVKKIENGKIELIPSECSQFPFTIRTTYEVENGNNEVHIDVLKIASLEEYNQFIKDIQSIRILSKLFK